MIRSLYEVLQVRPDADPEVIAAAYRALSKRYHPDVNKAADSTSVMKEINVTIIAAATPFLCVPANRLFGFIG